MCPMYTFVLIEADEGYTAAVYVATGTDLIPLTRLLLEPQAPYLALGCDTVHALIALLDTQVVALNPGRYLLKGEDPVYERWTLLILDTEARALLEY